MSITEQIEAKMERVGKRLIELTAQDKIKWEFCGDLSIRAKVEVGINHWVFESFPQPGLPIICEKSYIFRAYKQASLIDEVCDMAWTKELWTVAHRAAIDLSGAIEEMLQELDNLKGEH